MCKQSEIICGLEVSGQSRVSVENCTFFQKEVQFFFAVADPLQRKLYRSSDLAVLVNMDRAQIGMQLKRRRDHLDGIFQATSFLHKPPHTQGLRAGGYFLTMDCCKNLCAELTRTAQLSKARKDLGLIPRRGSIKPDDPVRASSASRDSTSPGPILTGLKVPIHFGNNTDHF
jgi:hypothetical protein